MSAHSVVSASPSGCDPCGDRQKVLLAEPGSPLFSVMLCPSCVWGLPVLHLPMRGDR